MGVNQKKKEVITRLIEEARTFRFCGPSDDPDEQTAVTAGFRHLIIQFQRLAGPILPTAAASQLGGIEVEINNLYSAYDAHSELEALLPDIEAAIDSLAESGNSPAPVDRLPMIAETRLDELRALRLSEFDLKKLIRLCEEINIAYAQKSYFATAMLTRGLLDHIPPVFGQSSFREVANNYGDGGRSFKDSMHHLETTARKVADAHLHMPIRKSETLPVAQQVNFAVQLDVLLAEIVRIMR